MKKILLYGIVEENLIKISKIFQDQNVKVHWLKNRELHQELLEVLESGECLDYEEAEYPMSLCLFAGYSKDDIYDTIAKIGELKIEKPVFATVTQKNIHWKIGRLLVDVNQEHIEMTRLSRDGQA